MSFAGMHSTSPILTPHTSGGAFGWIFSVSLAATASIVMKWWWDNVIDRKMIGQKPYRPSKNGLSSTTLSETTTPMEPKELVEKDSLDDLSFAEAATKINEAKFYIPTDEQLILYSLYKQATKGDAPIFFFSLSPADQAKHHAWSQNRQMPKEIASAQYVKHAVALLRKGGTKVSRRQSATNKPATPTTSVIGVGVSSRPAIHDEISEADMTPEERFRWAAGNNKAEVLRALLQGGAVAVDNRDAGGQTALHLAADAGALEAVPLLLQSGANVLAADQYGISILQAAVIAGKVPVCRYLLEHGADPDQRDQDGDTPRTCAEDDGDNDMQQLFQSRQSLLIGDKK